MDLLFLKIGEIKRANKQTGERKMKKKKINSIDIKNIILINWNTDIIILKRRYDKKNKVLTIDADIIKESRVKRNKRISKELNKLEKEK